MVVIEKQLTLEQAAELLGVNYHRAAALVRERILPCVRLGRRVRIDPGQLRQFIDAGGKALEGPGGWRKAVPDEPAEKPQAKGRGAKCGGRPSRAA
jgi:excisionase family DNA binding protein